MWNEIKITGEVIDYRIKPEMFGKDFSWSLSISDIVCVGIINKEEGYDDDCTFQSG